MGLFLILGVSGLVVLIGLFILSYVIENKEKEVSTNEDFIMIFDSDKSEEGAFGIIEKKDFSEDRVRIVFSSRDRNILKDLKETNDIKKLIQNKNFSQKIKSKVIFFDKKLFIDSGLSPNRKTYFAFPQNINRLPENTKNTQIGKIAMELINNASIERDAERLNKKRMESLENVATKDYGGKIYEKAVAGFLKALEEKAELSKTEIKDPKEK